VLKIIQNFLTSVHLFLFYLAMCFRRYFIQIFHTHTHTHIRARARAHKWIFFNEKFKTCTFSL